MKNRWLGVLYLMPLLAAAIIGGPILKFAALIVVVLGANEFYKAFQYRDISAASWFGILMCVLAFYVAFFEISHHWIEVGLIVLFFASTLLILLGKHTIVDIIITWFGALYVIIPILELVKLYEVELYGKQLSAMVLILAFSTDIFACAIGSKFGKHKLIPKVSPNKTIEGSVGAIVVTVIIAVIYSIAIGFNVWVTIPIAIISSIVAQMGDLFASSIKRYCGIKDFSNLIPGHGGILDRFDSVLFVSLFMSIVTRICLV